MNHPFNDLPPEMTSAEKDDVLRRIGHNLAENKIVLRKLAATLDEKPSRGELTQKRRTVAVLLAFLIMASAFLLDSHTELCGPGARIVPGVEYVANAQDGGLDFDELQRLLRDESPVACDLLVPVHSHDSDRWPTDPNLVGLLGYTLLTAGAWVWARREPPAPPREPSE